MSGFEMEEWINADPEKVFRAISDPKNASKINEKILKMEKITDAPLQKGTRFQEIRLVDGKEAETELLVEDIKAPHLYAVSAEQSGIKVLYTYSLLSENKGTKIHLQCDVSSGGLKKLMLPVVASIMKREDGSHLIQLKKVVEEESIDQ